MLPAPSVERHLARASTIVVRVGVGAGLVGIAIVARLPLEPILQGRNTFVLLEPAIAVAAWYGGLVSGVTATGVGAAATVLAYMPLAGSGSGGAPGEVLSLLLFLGNGLIITMLSSRLRGAVGRAMRARRAAEQAAARSESLQRLALALNRPMSPLVLAQTGIEQAVDLLGARGGLVATGRAGDRELRVLAKQGYTGSVEPGSTVSNNAGTPLGDVIRSGEPAVLRGRTERRARYPALSRQFVADGDSVTLPLLYQNVAVGAMYLNFDGSSGLGPDDREFLCSIGVQCGSALERSLLIQRTDGMAAMEQARAAELATVLHAIGDGLLVGNADGRVILANPAAQRLLGRTPPTLSELPSRAGDAPDEPTAENRFLARSPVRGRGWLEIAHFPVAAGGASSDVVIIRDITTAVEADLQRDAFLGVLSHELRTPITTIVAAIELLRGGASHRDERSRDLLDDIDAEATRLNRIVENLLVLTRSERGALEVNAEPVLVHRLVTEVVGREQAASPDVEIRLSAPNNLAPVEAEPTYVQQIVRNMLSNAVKYGRSPGRPIEVMVAQRDDAIETRVLDRGVGLGHGDADRLFSLFYRNPKVVRSAPGAGIGLYVCRLLAEAMGGTSWARSRPGGGAEFGFALPLMGEVERTGRAAVTTGPMAGSASS